MTAERYTSEQVLAFLDTEELGQEDFIGEEQLDGQEVFMEGSEEEFDDLEEMEIEGGILFIFFNSLLLLT